MTEHDNDDATAEGMIHGAEGEGHDEARINIMDLLGGMGMEPEPDPLDPAEARGILRGAFERLMAESNFKPGDFIQRKPGLYSGNSDLRGGVAIFIRYATPEPHTFDTPHPGAPVPIVDEDCILAIVTPTGEVGEYFACARYFEHAPTVKAVA